jgi:hypothetical protein
MGISNDYMRQAMTGLSAQQQAGLSGDERLRDFYGDEVTRSVLTAANFQMQENERVSMENQRMMREQQETFNNMMSSQLSEITEMRRQLELERAQFEHERWFNSLSPEDKEAYLEKKRLEEEERLEEERLYAERILREQEERDREWEEYWQKEQERRANLTPFQRKKEDILGNDIVEKILVTGAALVILVGGSVGLMALGF